MLTRYKGQLKLKDWAFAIAKRSTMRKARVALARRLAIIMHAMLRDGTEFVPTQTQQATRQEAASSSKRSDALRTEQTTARILLHAACDWPTAIQPSRPAPSLPHQAPAERAENTGILRRRQRRASRP